ncbi:hypothetical protein FOL47_011048, partial [Perkinsus chesapeaki]
MSSGPTVQGPVAVQDLLSEASKRFEEEFLRRPDAFSVSPAALPLLGTSAVHENISVSVAVDRYTVIVGRAQPDVPEVKVVSTSSARVCTFPLPSLDDEELLVDTSLVEEELKGQHHRCDWSLVHELRQLTGIDISGFMAVVHSTIPLSQSMNSSAALEVAMAALLQRLFPQSFCTVSQMDVLLACRRADQKCSAVGSNAFTSSALEQLTCTFSRQMHALHADASDVVKGGGGDRIYREGEYFDDTCDARKPSKMRIFDFIPFPPQPTIRLLLFAPLGSQDSLQLPL